MIRKEGARVMSLTDGTKKMSKSDPSDLSRMNLLDSPDEIQKKIKRCKTDPIKGLEFDNPERPECNNLLIQQKYQAVIEDKGYLESVLREGREKAEAIANATLLRVKTAMGYTRPL